MKKIIFLFALICLSSCSNDDNHLEESSTINTLEILEYRGGFYTYKFSNNKLSRIEQDNIIEFLYDTDNRLSQLIFKDLSENIIDTKVINYDSNNRVIAIGDRIFSYDSIENIYIEDSSFYEFSYSENGLNSIERNYNYYKINTENVVYSANRHEYYFDENTNTNQISESEYTHIYLEQFFENNNIIKTEINNNNNETNYSYDLTYLNPLNTNSSNLKNIFLLLGISNLHFHKLFSNNNLIEKRYGINDPESDIYINHYNNNNLPISVDHEIYYLSNLESQIPNAYQYYYTGDVIPN